MDEEEIQGVQGDVVSRGSGWRSSHTFPDINDGIHMLGSQNAFRHRIQDRSGIDEEKAEEAKYA